MSDSPHDSGAYVKYRVVLHSVGELDRTIATGEGATFETAIHDAIANGREGVKWECVKSWVEAAVPSVDDTAEWIDQGRA